MSQPKQKRRRRIAATADNRFTAHTGIPVIKLTGASDCWVTGVKVSGFVPVKKLAYAYLNGWQPYECEERSKRMRLLRVTQSCGVDQCVNPDHLTAKEYDLMDYGLDYKKVPKK